MRLKELRELVRSHGFHDLRSRSKTELWNKFQTALKTAPNPPHPPAQPVNSAQSAVQNPVPPGVKNPAPTGVTNHVSSAVKTPAPPGVTNLHLRVGLVDRGGGETGEVVSLRYPLALEKDAELLDRALMGRGWGHVGEMREDPVTGVSLLFGELLPSGVQKMMAHLDVQHAKTFVDLGSGMGKLAIQVFLTHSTLDRVVAIEYSAARFNECARFLHRLVRLNSGWATIHSKTDSYLEVVAEGGRRFELWKGDLLTFGPIIQDMDVAVCEADIPHNRQKELVQLLSLLKSKTRVMLYHNPLNLPGVTFDQRLTYARFPDGSTWTPLHPDDSRIQTSWSKFTGHKFDFWTKS